MTTLQTSSILLANLKIFCKFKILQKIHRILFLEQRNFGTFRGLILRSQLIVVLQHKLYNETAESWSHKGFTIKYFRDAYPRYPNIQVSYIDLFLNLIFTYMAYLRQY